MRFASRLFVLISTAFILCLSDLYSSGAIAGSTEVSAMPGETLQASSLQPGIQPKLKFRAESAIDNNRVPAPPENKFTPEVSIVLSDPQLKKIVDAVKPLKEKNPHEAAKGVVEIAKNIVEVGAIFFGGAWTYNLFIRQRQKYPRANLVHGITHRPIGNGKLLLNIDAIVSNAGDVLIRIVSGELRIQQVLPLPSKAADEIASSVTCFPGDDGRREFSWDTSARKLKWPPGRPAEVEPGEESQFHYDCILPEDTAVIKVYTYYKNEVKSGRNIGWNLTTVYDLRTEAGSRGNGGLMKQPARPPIPGPSPIPCPDQEEPKPNPEG